MEKQLSQNYNSFPLTYKTIGRHSKSWTHEQTFNGVTLVSKEYHPLVWLTPEELKNRRDAIYRHAITLQNVQSPLFAKIIDVCERNKSVVVTREWVKGISFSDYLKRQGYINIRSLKPILEDISEAIRIAGQHGLPYPRIHPGDLILDHDGRIILTDYGFDLVAGRFHLSNFKANFNSHRYPNGAQTLAIFVHDVLTGRISNDVQRSNLSAGYLPKRLRHAIHQASKNRMASPEVTREFVASLYPPSNLALFQMAWKPAAAMGIFGALATVGGYALSQRETPHPPAIVATIQPVSLEANLSQEDIALLQLAIRRQGVAALIHPAIANIFHLSQDQYNVLEESLAEQRDQTVTMLNNAASGQNMDVTNEMKVQREELQTRILMIMTPKQRTLWESLNSGTSSDDVPPL